MPLEAGMILALLSQSTNNFKMIQMTDTIWLQILRSLMEVHRFLGESRLQLNLARDYQKILKSEKNFSISISSCSPTVRLQSGACVPCRDRLVDCACHWMLTIQMHENIFWKSVYACTSFEHVV